MNKNEKNSKESNILSLIPKAEKYIQYIIEMIIKIPRTEKYSIGTEYKLSIYRMLTNIVGLSKTEESKKINCLNIVDTELNLQRIYLRIMYKNGWINDKKLNTCMEQIYEIGKILGGLVKHYGKHSKK